MSIIIRLGETADLPAADRVLQAAFARPTSFIPLVTLHRAMEPKQFWVAEDAGKVVGTIGAVDYRKIGYIGLTAVDPKRQRQGIARQLIEQVLKTLDAAGCQSILLDATPPGAPLYEAYGFVDDATAYVYERRARIVPAPPTVEVTTDATLDEIVAFDEPRFGASRQKLFAALWPDHYQRCLVARGPRGRVTGYVFARDPVLGPWAAIDVPTAAALLAAAQQFAHQYSPQVLVPRSNEAARLLLAENGFVQQRTLRHMRRGGRAHLGRSAELFGQSSFAHG